MPLHETSALSFDEIFAALGNEFDSNDEGGDDVIQLKDLSFDDGKIYIGVESRQTEVMYTFNVAQTAHGLHVAGTSETDIILAGSAQDVAYAVLSFISTEVENIDEDRDN